MRIGPKLTLNWACEGCEFFKTEIRHLEAPDRICNIKGHAIYINNTNTQCPILNANKGTLKKMITEYENLMKLKQKTIETELKNLQ